MGNGTLGSTVPPADRRTVRGIQGSHRPLHDHGRFIFLPVCGFPSASGGALCCRSRVGAAVASEQSVQWGVSDPLCHGMSPKAVARRLNAERCLGPGKEWWNPQHDSRQSRPGYRNSDQRALCGGLVWNRLRFVKDPDTRKRVSRPNAPSEWVTTAIPESRIVDDELWNRGESTTGRDASHRATIRSDSIRLDVRSISSPVWRKGAECGGGCVMYWRDRLACFGARSRGTCTNRLTISRLEPDGDQLKITPKATWPRCSTPAETEEVTRQRRPHGPNKVGCGGGI